jgi:Domain of Unknown Function (DUF928)
MKISKRITKFAVAISLILTSFIIIHPIYRAFSGLPEPPKTGTPIGDSNPGGKRPETTCKETIQPLTALLANNGSDFTTSEYPTFWFYIPYSSEEIRNIKFLLLDGKERRTIYRTSIKLTGKPGIIKVTIPTEQKYALKVNELYRWRLNLDCNPDKTLEPDLEVDAWVRRKEIDSQLENELKAIPNQKYVAYGNNNIWYDAINNLAELHFSNPNSRELSDAWRKLLTSLDNSPKNLANEPLVTYELVSSED